MSISYRLIDSANGAFVLVGKNLRATTSPLAVGTYTYVIEATYSDGWKKNITGTVTVTGLQNLAPTSTTISSDIGDGNVVLNFPALSAGETRTITPNDGRFIFNSTGRLVRGLTAISAGTINATITQTLGAQTASTQITINVTAVTNNLMPVDTHLITVGPSIQNVTNMRAPRHWLSFFCNGHFYTGPATNQSVGGASATQIGSTRGGANPYNYWGAREEYTIRQIPSVASGRKCLIFFDDFINDMVPDVVSFENIQTEINRRINMFLGANSSFTNVWIAFGTIIDGSATATGTKFELRKAVNDYIISLKGSHPRLIVLSKRLTTYTASMAYDGLHPAGNGAMVIGKADADDLKPYMDTASVLYGDTSGPNNLETDWNMDGTTGVAGTGSSGTVATGWTVYATSNGQSSAKSGVTIGVTAVCSKTVDSKGKPAQKIDLQGTPTADGYMSFVNSVSFLNQAGGYVNGWFKVKASGIANADPIGITGIGAQVSVLGGVMNKQPESNAGTLTQSFEGVIRTVPVVGLINGADKQDFEFAIGMKSGVPIDVSLIISQSGVERAETLPYATPFNQGTPFFGGPANPLAGAGGKPSMANPKTVGTALTLQVAPVTGGGITWSAFDVVDSNDVVLATRAPANGAMSYTLLSTDAGKTIRLRQTGSNSFGSIIVNDGERYLIPGAVVTPPPGPTVNRADSSATVDSTSIKSDAA